MKIFSNHSLRVKTQFACAGRRKIINTVKYTPTGTQRCIKIDFKKTFARKFRKKRFYQNLTVKRIIARFL